MPKYYLIPANYLNYDFNMLFNENMVLNGKVLWRLNSNDPHNMEVGDICYLYYSHLPDKTNRIILRGVITSVNEEDMVNGESIPCFAISDIETINWKNSGRTKFTYAILRDKYNVKVKQNKRQLSDERKGDKQLREKLEEFYQKDKDKLNLMEFKDEIYKRSNCFFKDIIEGSHSTFICQNGLPYYEVHHFILKKIGTEHNEVQAEIDNPQNLISLCSNCHNMVHYAESKTRKKMIKRIYDSNSKFFDKIFGGIAKQANKSMLDWLYSIYDIGENK